MSIIENLGITPDYDFSDCVHKAVATFSVDAIKELKRQRDEMFEALIDCLRVFAAIGVTREAEIAQSVISIIEKATGKTWDEIVALKETEEVE